MNMYRIGKMNLASITGSFVLLMFCLASIASAENYKAIILDGYEKDCTVSRSGRDYDCRINRKLYAGDKVTKKPDIQALKVKYAPYTGAQALDMTSLVVTFDPPKDKRGIVKTLKDAMGFARTASTLSIGATRTGSSKFIPQPGNNATLLPKQKSTFTWESDGGKFIVFRDSKNTEIFRKELKDESFLRLSPLKIGMKPGEVYTWSIEGVKDGKQFNIRLLSEELIRQVANDRRIIRKEASDKVDKLIQTALYLQFISDAYPQDIDLYWLSYLVLEKIENERTLKKDEKRLIHDLRINYAMHVRNNICNQ